MYYINTMSNKSIFLFYVCFNVQNNTILNVFMTRFQNKKMKKINICRLCSILYENSIHNKIVCKSLMWHPHMGN